ncbi:MAG: signal peptidase I [Dehalococcoidia bacterium]|nr:signal peptidase I [Dehalococcoidia bacterium]
MEKTDLRGQSIRPIIREIIVTVLLALILFVAIRSVVHNFEVSGVSMDPTLHNGQFVIVNKAAYWFDNPKRGDIVVFHSPTADRDIIHRIIGLPGETIEIKNGVSYIDGQKLEEEYLELNSRSLTRSEIPDDSYFIIGDNRDVAGWDIVPRNDIIGKAWIIYWPFGDWGMVPNHAW